MAKSSKSAKRKPDSAASDYADATGVAVATSKPGLGETMEQAMVAALEQARKDGVIDQDVVQQRMRDAAQEAKAAREKP
jgi:hypothetical protein